MRPMQTVALCVGFTLFTTTASIKDSQSPSKLNTLPITKQLALFDRTGGGKTHVIRMFGVTLRGVHIIIHLVLALTEDQTIRFQEGSDEYGSIEVHNMDKEAKSCKKTRNKIIGRMKELAKGTTSTIFLFTSPQLITSHPDFIGSIK